MFGLAILMGTIGIAVAPSAASAEPSTVAAAAIKAGCTVSESTNGGLITCPRSRPLPDYFTALLPEAAHTSADQTNRERGGSVEPMATDGFADYYCDYGVTCWVYDVMGTGYSNHYWEGYNKVTGTLEQVYYEEGLCTDPSGCQEVGYWTPPNNDWRGENIYVDSDNFIEIVQCWCGNNPSGGCYIHPD
jgi:hypothetical protein